LLRGPLTATSNFLARDILKLPHPSIIERYTNIFFVFFLSGMLHTMTDWIRGIPPRDSFALIWFILFSVGIIIEDSVQALWRRLSKTSQSQNRVPATAPWQKFIGYVWVIVWFTLTYPPYAHTARSIPSDRLWIVPFSIAEKIGLPASGALLVLGGVVLKVVFGVEE
jgi:hypothetical protein